MMKKILSLSTAAIGICLTCSFTAMAAPITETQAKDAVAPYLTSGSTFLYSEIDDGCMELKYTNETAQEGYKWKVGLETGALVSFESERYLSHGGSQILITKADAEKKVTNEQKDATILSVQTDYDDGIEYKVHFKTDTYYGKYEIHPETGVILEREITFSAWKEGISSSKLITRERAIELAKEQVPGATVSDVDLDWDHDAYCYEIELYKDGIEYEIKIHAETGAVRSNYHEKSDWHQPGNSTSSQTQKDIGVEKARQIALEFLPGGTIRKCKPDYENGKLVYEVEIVKGGWEYELEIDAATGQIIKQEKEYDD